MIRSLIDLLAMKDYYGVSKEIDIAKGKYKFPYTWKQGKEQIKRILYGR